MIATVGGATYEIKGFGRCSQYLTTKADCTRALAAFGFVVYPHNIMDSPYSYYPPCALSTLRPGCQRALIFSAPPLPPLRPPRILLLPILFTTLLPTLLLILV